METEEVRIWESVHGLKGGPRFRAFLTNSGL